MLSAQELATESMEKCLIGAILVDQDVMPSIADRITVEAFSNSRNRAIFNAAGRCWKNRRPSDLITVHAELSNDPDVTSERDWMSLAADLSESIVHLYEVGYACRGPMYADAVVAFARRRAISDAGANIVKMAHDGETIDSGMVMAEVMAGMDKFGATTENRGPQTYDEIIPDYQERITRMKSGEIPNLVTATGWRAIDRKLAGGLYPGELVILGARPSMGKTAFALQMAHQVAKSGKHVVVFSAEMSKESLLKRAAAELMGKSINKPEAELDDQEYDQFLQSLERLRRLPVSIDDTPGISTAQMQVRIQNMQRKHPVGLVVFDYIELAGDQVKADSEERRINSIVKALKNLARTIDVPVLALCQLNRQVESRGNKRPMLADLRYSGSIEQDADKVLFLYRHDYYVAQGTSSPESGTEGMAEVIVSKHRNGEVGEINLRFTPETMTFHTIDYSANLRPYQPATV